MIYQESGVFAFYIDIYFILTVNGQKCEVPKMKRWKMICNIFLKAIRAVLCLCIIISFLFSDRFFDKAGKNSCKKIYYEYPFSGIENIAADDQYVYCFNQYFQAVNAYDHNGKYQFTLKVPNDDNGAGCMYLKDKTLCVKNKRGDVYQYESGNLKNKILMKDQLVKVYDKNGKKILSENIKDDREVYYYKNKKLTTISYSDSEDILANNSDTTDTEGNKYSVAFLFPRLIKNGKTIMQPDNLKILCSSPMRSVMIFFLYELAILLISKIYSFIRKVKL